MRLSILLALASAASAAEMFPFQLPWDDASPSITNVSWLNDKPAGRDGFVHVKDGHLFAGEKRLRIFGVNMCFSGNFPAHADAEKIAARMAKFGINCVRFHHMDMFNAPAGIFEKDGRTLDPQRLDRLDYFIAELKKHGIYANLNLHVSRTYPDRPKTEKKGNPQFDKGVDNYHAPMIALQKEYARDLLTHVNKYTGNAYAAEPAVALVEINNENALGFQWFAGEMDELPAVYREDLESQWGAWVLKKHGNDEAARKAWSDGARAAGTEMLANRSGDTPVADSDASKGATPARTAVPVGDRSVAAPIEWNFEAHGPSMAKGTVKDGVVSVTVDEPGTESWHVQFTTGGLRLEAGAYEVKFRARAPMEGSVSVGLQQSASPWKMLGSANAKLGTEWRDVSVIVAVGAAEEKARLTIGGMGLTEGRFEFSDFSLTSVGVDGDLVRDEKGRVPIVKKRDLSRTTQAKKRDWQEFIWDTETVYWNGMREFLKKELGVRALIVGTQGAWSPGHVQSGMDVIDSHAYWQHPHFEGGDWNPEKWTVKNIPMAGTKDGGTLPGLAAQRVAGKPFICTEYNHSAPNTYGAETAPLLAAFAALQDWDGVFIFAYSHNDKWQQEHFDSFFDIARHPVKMATLPAAAVSFRRADLGPGVTFFNRKVTKETALQRTLEGGPSNIFPKLDENHDWVFFFGQVTSTFGGDSDALGQGLISSPIMRGGLRWDRRVLFSEWLRAHESPVLGGDGSYGFVGQLDEPAALLSSIAGDELLIAGNAGRKDFSAIQVTAMPVVDGSKNAEEAASYTFNRNFPHMAKRFLITATGPIENTNMDWKNAEKTTVGRDWGKAPVLVEGPAATIELPGGGKFNAWALDERGQRREEIPVKDAKLEIGPQWKTLWYEVERQ